MEVSKQLIASFFKHECSPSEADAVKQYLEQNQELLNTYLNKSEWEQALATSVEPNTYWQQQWNEIEKKRKGNVVSINFRKWAVAAAVLLLVFGASYFYFTKEDAKKPIAAAKAKEQKSVLNTTEKEMAVLLPDGSQVTLEKGSEIKYKDGFEADKRDIILNGTAVFEVAKDKSKPFTVHSGEITTTALGTKFKVTYPGKNSHATVHLYEGKVVVKAASSKNIQPSYLVPGDVLKYENNKFTIAHSIATNQNAGESRQLSANYEKEINSPDKLISNKRIEKAGSQPSIAIPQWYKFEKESLKNVLDQLAGLYNVTIDYDKADLTNKYFIGRFEQNQPIEKILKTITTLNDLQLEKTGDSHFRIKK